MTKVLETNTVLSNSNELFEIQQEEFTYSHEDMLTHFPLPRTKVNSDISKITHILIDKLNLPQSMYFPILKVHTDLIKKLPKKKFDQVVVLASIVVIFSKFYYYQVSINDVISILEDLGIKIKKRRVLKCMYFIKSLNKKLSITISPEKYCEIILNKLDENGLINANSLEEKIRYKKLLEVIAKALLSELKNEPVNSNPRSIAACAIYTSSKLISQYRIINCKQVKQKDVARVSNLALYTIRENFTRYFLKYIVNPPKDILLYLESLQTYNK